MKDELKCDQTLFPPHSKESTFLFKDHLTERCWLVPLTSNFLKSSQVWNYLTKNLKQLISAWDNSCGWNIAASLTSPKYIRGYIIFGLFHLWKKIHFLKRKPTCSVHIT